MRVRKASLIFKNVISATIQSNDEEWRSDIADFKDLVTRPGVYPIGPVFFTISKNSEVKEDSIYTLYIPMNLPINFKSNEACSYIGDFKLKECLAIKQIDLDDDIEDYYKVLNACANENEINLGDKAYHVYLENYGVEIMDIYVPII